jgi:hypothetical protein
MDAFFWRADYRVDYGLLTPGLNLLYGLEGNPLNYQIEESVHGVQEEKVMI